MQCWNMSQIKRESKREKENSGVLSSVILVVVVVVVVVAFIRIIFVTFPSLYLLLLANLLKPCHRFHPPPTLFLLHSIFIVSLPLFTPIYSLSTPSPLSLDVFHPRYLHLRTFIEGLLLTLGETTSLLSL